jgi:hypothetical protein
MTAPAGGGVTLDERQVESPPEAGRLLSKLELGTR